MPKRKKKRKWYLSDNAETKHHIIPTSRGGRNDKENIAIVPNKHHAIYHALFCNRMPVEIIIYLVDHFWNGQWIWVELALERRKHEKESD